MAQIKIKDLSEIMKGMENIPEDQRSSRLQETKAMLAEAVGPQFINKPASTGDSSGEFNKTQSKILNEVKKTNSLLSGFIQSISKVFESNNELIERMLISQEQEKERGRRAIDVPIKTGDKTKAERSGGAFDASAFGAFAGLAAILAGTIDKIIPALKDFYDKTIKPYLDPVIDFIKTASDFFVNNKEVSSTLIKILNALGVRTFEYTKGGQLPGFLGTEEDIGEKKRRNSQRKAAQAKAAEAKAAFAGDGPDASEEDNRRRMSAYDEATKKQSRKTLASNAAGARAGAKTGATSVPSVAPKASRKEKLKELVKKTVEKSVGGAVGLVSKSVPLLGAFFAGGSAAGRLSKGDFMGAFIDGAQAVISIAEATPYGATVGPQLAAASSALGTGQLINDIRRDALGIEELKDAELSIDEIQEAINEYLSEVWNKISSYKGRGPTEQELNQTVERNVGISFPEGRQQRRLNPETGELEVITPAANGPSNVTPAGMSQARQLEEDIMTRVTPSTRSAPNIESGQSGSTVINDNRTINNIDNSKAGGGGSAPGFPNSSTAPSNPWDAPLYGANMNYF